MYSLQNKNTIFIKFSKISSPAFEATPIVSRRTTIRYDAFFCCTFCADSNKKPPIKILDLRDPFQEAGIPLPISQLRGQHLSPR